MRLGLAKSLAILAVVSTQFLPTYEAEAARASCKIENASYVSLASSKLQLRFVKHQKQANVMGDLFLKVSVNEARVLWYIPETGSGYSTINLISVADPTRPNWLPPDPDSRKGRPNADQRYYAFDRDLLAKSDYPKSGSIAPELIFIPEITTDFYYSTSENAKRDYYPRTFFKLASCQPL